MKRALSSFLAVATLACEPPPIFATADSDQIAKAARVEGTVVVSTAARGRVLLFLYDAARPPPPVGTGRPLTFTVLTEDRVFGANPAVGDVGPFFAPFVFSLVKGPSATESGSYLVRGFVDANADFIPWYSVTSEVNAGDVGGAAVDASLQERALHMELDASGAPVAVVDVRVVLADTRKVPVDRPAFSVSATSQELDLVSGAQLTLVKETLDLAEAVAPVVEHSPGFLAQLVDANRDGTFEDFWPHVVVRKLAAARTDASAAQQLLDENDVDKDGVLDMCGSSEPGPCFVDYEHRDAVTRAVIAPDGKPDLVVLKAGFVRPRTLQEVQGLMPELLLPDGGVRTTPTPIAQLKLQIQPVAIDASATANPELAAVPPGRYAITVIQPTGQTWRVPNELSPDFASPLGFPAVSSQGFTLTVP